MWFGLVRFFSDLAGFLPMCSIGQKNNFYEHFVMLSFLDRVQAVQAEVCKEGRLNTPIQPCMTCDLGNRHVELIKPL